ncbi:MAG: hypothetical protein JWM89_753 [Acidimicrobiales bacterium]|nr:hypothetical protein [Acidimicrobiales bacterium]
MFQQYNLVPTLTALENVTLPLELDGTSGDALVRSLRAGHRRCSWAGQHGRPRPPAVLLAQVMEASKMPLIDSSSVASNSASLCWALSPSVSAREKLAMTPGLRLRRSFASARE